ncbi:MAG: stage IV sporulation protein A [Bacilli bacterium]
MSENIIKEVVTRTNGEMYLGVVGPVRSGKSTFIRRFMELKVLPYIKDEHVYHKVVDELPQSGEGKTIMTVEPKFVPTNNMSITVDGDLNINIRLVDCVGYIIENAKGYLNEDGTNRLVHTPWFSEPIPFGDAAGIGTRKVIESHSNIGVLVTSDGSFGEFSRQDYELIEEKMIAELKELDKPFVVIMNTTHPSDGETKHLCQDLTDKYGTSVIPVDIQKMNDDDVDMILKLALNEFDISELNIDIPSWVQELDSNISFKKDFTNLLADVTGNYRKMKDVFSIQSALKECPFLTKVEITNIEAGTGLVNFDIGIDENIYKDIIEEILGEKIDDKSKFLKSLQSLRQAKGVYDHVGNLEKVYQVGYDIIVPPVNEMKLHEPTIIKQSGRYGISIKATAETLLVCKVDVDSVFEPIIGSEEQSQVLVDNMLEDYKNDPEKLWQSEIFGRKLCDVINDGIKVKVNQVPDLILSKYRDGIIKVVNKSKGGVIAIVL